MIYSVTTNTNIQTIKDEIAQKAKEVGFGVLTDYPFKEMLEEKGHPIQEDITVFELCNPEAANKVLTAHPEVAAFLPCRVSLYEKDSKAILTTMNLDSIKDGFDVNEDVQELMQTVYTQLKTLLNSWN